MVELRRYHSEISHVDILIIVYDLSDVFPLKLLLVVLEDMFILVRQNNVGPLQDMTLY